MKKSLFIIFAFACFYGCAPRNYTQIMKKSSKRMLGSDFKHYNFFSYPTNNYGVATCYVLNATAPNFECDTWNCLRIEEVPSDSKNLLDLDGFASVGTGPKITLTEKVKRDVAIKAIMPEVFKTLGISLDASGTGVKTIDMSFGPGHIRFLRKQEFSKHLNALPSTERLAVFFASGELVYVFSDVVIEDYTVSISVDNSLESQLDAKLNSNPASGTLAGTSLGTKLSKNSQGKFTLSSTNPLVIARWTKKVSGPGVLSNENPGTDYPIMMHITK